MLGDPERVAAVEAAVRGFREDGGPGLLRALAEGQEQLHGLGRESAFNVAVTHALLGDRAAALRWLETAIRAREPSVLAIHVEIAFRPLREDSAFRRLAARAGAPQPRSRWG